MAELASQALRLLKVEAGGFYSVSLIFQSCMHVFGEVYGPTTI